MPTLTIKPQETCTIPSRLYMKTNKTVQVFNSLKKPVTIQVVEDVDGLNPQVSLTIVKKMRG